MHIYECRSNYLLFRTVHMDHYSKCNICGEMVKNMRQHEKHKHRGNQKASEATADTKLLLNNKYTR